METMIGFDFRAGSDFAEEIVDALCRNCLAVARTRGMPRRDLLPRRLFDEIRT